MIPPLTWRDCFYAQIKTLFGMTVEDVSMSNTDLEHYMDLEPREAALVYGEENGLDRIDRGWFT